MDQDNPAVNSATATTQSAGDNSTKVATTAYVNSAIPTLTSGRIPFAGAGGVLEDDASLTYDNSTDKELKVLSAGSVKLTLEADTDDTTETDHASITMSQDGGATSSLIGFEGGGDTFHLKTVSSDVLSLGTNNIARLSINTSGTVFIPDLTATRLTATGGSMQLASVADLTTWVGGTSNVIDVTDDGDGTVTVDISSSYAGQTSINTVGTISTGTWKGTTVGSAFGGTGQTTYASGEILIGGTFGLLEKNTLTEGEGIDITNAAGSITIAGEDASTTNKGISELATDAETNTGTDTGRTLTPSNLAAWTGSTNIVTLGTIATGTWEGTTIAVNQGGTGQTSYTNGQLLIGNTTGNTLAKATLTGTANQVTVTNGTGTITLATPQDIATGSSPTFTGLTVSGLTAGRVPFMGTGGLFDDDASLTFNSTTNNLNISSAGSVSLTLEADTDNSTETDHPSLNFSQDGGITTASVGYSGSTGDNVLRIVCDTSNDTEGIELLTAGGTLAVHIDSDQNVGIQTGTPTVPLQILGGSDASLTDGTGYLVIGGEDTNNIVIDNNEIIARNDAAASVLIVNKEGGGVVIDNVSLETNYIFQLPNDTAKKAKANAWDTYSDERLKENIITLTSAVDKVIQLRGVTFTWRESAVTPPKNHIPSEDAESETYSQEELDAIAASVAKVNVGFIAQEVALICPEVVNFDDEGIATAIDYSKLVPLVVEAFKEYKETTDARLAALESA